MEGDAVYIKTPAGREAVRLRTHRLSARERATLIMIDGRRGVSELRTFSPVPDEVEQPLKTFLDAGLIALAPATLPELVTPTASLFMEEALSSPALCVAEAPMADPDLEKARRYILDVAKDALGAEAASFTSKLALLDNAQELLSLAHHLREALYRFSTVKEADQFWETVREIAPKT